LKGAERQNESERVHRERRDLMLFQLQGIIALDAREECGVYAGGARGHQTKDTFSIVPATMYQQVADHRSGVPTVNGLAMRQRARPHSMFVNMYGDWYLTRASQARARAR